MNGFRKFADGRKDWHISSHIQLKEKQCNTKWQKKIFLVCVENHRNSFLHTTQTSSMYRGKEKQDGTHTHCSLEPPTFLSAFGALHTTMLGLHIKPQQHVFPDFVFVPFIRITMLPLSQSPLSTSCFALTPHLLPLFFSYWYFCLVVFYFLQTHCLVVCLPLFAAAANGCLSHIFIAWLLLPQQLQQQSISQFVVWCLGCRLVWTGTNFVCPYDRLV